MPHYNTTAGAPVRKTPSQGLPTQTDSDVDDVRFDRAPPAAAVGQSDNIMRIRADVSALRQQVQCVQNHMEHVLQLLSAEPMPGDSGYVAMPRKYIVVLYIEANRLAVVPRHWVVNGMCQWDDRPEFKRQAESGLDAPAEYGWYAVRQIDGYETSECGFVWRTAVPF